jgi:hypothetical protein
MNPRTVLRFEGLGLFSTTIAAYLALEAPLWLFLVLALAPDISMLGYLAGPQFGSRLYNAFHTYVGPIALGTGGFVLGMPPLVWVALVWTAHIGIDRAIGYGLKYPTGFTHTHLADVESPTDPAFDDLGDDVNAILAGDDSGD